MEWAAQRGGGVTDSEGVQGTLDVVLRDIVWGELLVMGGWLDWVILWVFSNLRDSMIHSLPGNFRTCLGDLPMHAT